MPKKAAVQPVKKVKAGTSKAQASARKSIFANAYIANGGNATQAAKTAGYSERSAGVYGHELLKDPEVRAVVDDARGKAAAESGLTAEVALRELASIVKFDIRKLFDENGEPLPLHKLDDATAAAISHMSAHGPVSYDKNAGIEKAMKMFGLYEKDNRQKGDSLELKMIFE